MSGPERKVRRARRQWGKYRLIYADPPWLFRDKNAAKKRGAAFKYPVVKTEDLMRLDVEALADRECVIAMWGCSSMFEDALRLMKAWGFRYSTIGFWWVKTGKADAAQARLRRELRRAGMPAEEAKRYAAAVGDAGLIMPTRRYGQGGTTRQDAEPLLIGYRGRLGRMEGAADILQTQFFPRGRHSAKPPEFRDLLVRLFGDRPRVELFARDRTEGWDAHGNEVPGGADVVLDVKAPTTPEPKRYEDAETHRLKQTSLFDFLGARLPDQGAAAHEPVAERLVTA